MQGGLMPSSPALPKVDILHYYSMVTKLDIDFGTGHMVYSDFSI